MKEIKPIYSGDLNGALISDLSNRPNSTADAGDGGLTAKELKERFDEYPRIVMERLNDIIRAFNSDDATSYVKMPSNDLGESFNDFLKYFDPNKKEDIGDLVCAEYMKETDDAKNKYTLNAVLVDVASHIKNVGLAIADVKNKIEELASASDQIDDKVIADLTSRIVSLENMDSSIREAIIDLNERAATLEEYINAGGGNLPPGSEIGEVIVDRQTAYTRTVPADASTTALLDRYYGESEVVCNYSPVSMTSMTGPDKEFTIFAYPPGNIEKLELSISASLPPEENGVYGAYGLEILVNGNYVYNKDHPFIYDTEFSVEFAVGDLAPEVKIRLFTASNSPESGTVVLSNIRLVEAGSKRGVTGISTIELESIESSTGDTVDIPDFGYNEKMYSGNYVDFSEKVFVYKTRYFYDAAMTGWKRIGNSAFKATYLAEDLGLTSRAIIASASSTYGNSYKDGVAGTRVVVGGTYIEVYAYVNANLDSLDAFLEYMSKIRFGIIYTLSDAESNAGIVLKQIGEFSVKIPVEPGGTLTFHSDKEGQAYDATIFYLKAKDEEEEPPEGGGGEDPTPPEGGGEDPTPPEGGDEPSNPDDGGDEPPTIDPEETPPEIKDEYDLEGTVGTRVSEEETAYVRRVPSNVGETAILSTFYYDTIMNYNIAPVNDLELAPDSPSKTITIYPHKTGQWEVSFYVDVGVRILQAKALVDNSPIASYESTSVNNGEHSFSFYYNASPQSEAYHDVVELVFSMDTPFEESYIISRICVVPQGERRTAETGYPISVAPIRFIGSDGKSPTFGAIPPVRESDTYKFDDDYCSYRTFNATLKSAFARRATLVKDQRNAVFGDWKLNEEGAAYRKVNVFEKDIKTSWFLVTGLTLAQSIKPNVFTERIDSKTNYVSLGHFTSIHTIDGVEYLRLRLNVHKQIDTIDKFKEYIKSIKFNFLVKAKGNYSHETETTEGSKVISVTPGGTILIESNIPNHPIKSDISYLITGKDSGGEL